MAIGVGYLGYHKTVTGHAIQSLVPEWQVEKATSDNSRPLTTSQMCVAASNTGGLYGGGEGLSGGGGGGDPEQQVALNWRDFQRQAEVISCRLKAGAGGAVIGGATAAVSCVATGPGALICQPVGVPAAAGVGFVVGYAASELICQPRGSTESRPDPDEEKPPEAPFPPPRKKFQAKSALKVQCLDGTTVEEEGLSGLDALTQCSRGNEGETLNRYSWPPMFESIVRGATGDWSSLPDNVKECLMNKRAPVSMLNCAEKQVFRKVLDRCRVDTSKKLDDTLCGIKSWDAYWIGKNGQESGIPACPQCCMFVDMLWDRVRKRNRRDCPGKVALWNILNSEDCRKVRKNRYGKMCPQSGPIACGGNSTTVASQPDLSQPVLRSSSSVE